MTAISSLKGKNAFVAGAGSGIGRAIAIAFAKAGANVACVDIDGASAQATAKEAEASDVRTIGIACDVSREDSVDAAAKMALATFGRVDVLVSGAAGRDPTATVLELTLEQWNSVFAVNVAGAFLLSRALLPSMIAGGGGSVILIASQHGSVGAAGRVVYTASKGALIQMAKTMAADHAAQNIRVNTLSPGAVETGRMTKHLLGRLGLPAEIAAAAVFLASDASSFMTGSDLLVDGGYNAI